MDGAIRAPIMLRMVDFPHPDGPTIATNSWSRTSNETPETAGTSRGPWVKVLERSRRAMRTRWEVTMTTGRTHLDEQVIHRHPPAREGGLGLRDLAAVIDGRGVWRCRAVDLDHVLAEQVDVPDDQAPRGEVVAALARHRHLGLG